MVALLDLLPLIDCCPSAAVIWPILSVDPLAPVDAMITPEFSLGNALSAVLPARSRARDSSFTTYNSSASSPDKPLVSGSVPSLELLYQLVDLFVGPLNDVADALPALGGATGPSNRS